MDEYKYKLLNDRTERRESELQAFIDQLDSVGKLYLYSAELDEDILTLTWNWVIPNKWRNGFKFELSDKTEVAVENKVLDYPKICPSLEQALWHLVYLKDAQQMPVEKAPDNLLEKAEILDSYQFIDVEYQFEPVGTTAINSMESMFYYRKHIKGYEVLEAGRDYLEKRGIK